MIRLAKPLLGGEEMAEIASVLGSGFLSRGPKVAEFEEALAGYLGVKHAISVSSGTAALHLSVLALGLNEAMKSLCQIFLSLPRRMLSRLPLRNLCSKTFTRPRSISMLPGPTVVTRESGT
jgi:hypothetical protein